MLQTHNICYFFKQGPGARVSTIYQKVVHKKKIYQNLSKFFSFISVWISAMKAWKLPLSINVDCRLLDLFLIYCVLTYRFGITALMAAASNGHLQAVQRLLKAGAKLEARCEVIKRSKPIFPGELRGERRRGHRSPLGFLVRAFAGGEGADQGRRLRVCHHKQVLLFPDKW